MNTTTAHLLEAAAPHHGERAARAIWSQIVEPNDPTVGRLIAEHGAVDALAVIADGAATDVDGDDDLRKRALPRVNAREITRTIRLAETSGATLVTPESAEWPAQLEHLGDNTPVALWVRGTPQILAAETITALTGARASTNYGEHVARELAAGLIDRGHILAAGGAYGIDAITHRSALAAEVPTIAVMAGGVDRFYPAGHDDLLTRVTETGGAIISEVAPGTTPTKWRFLARGRILAALAGWTVIAEAGARSGSLHTARQALALRRPVGAMPGMLTSPTSAGCHRLIREEGATLITSAADLA